MSNTIVALATPAGIGGIAVIRLSGEGAFAIADCIFVGKIKAADAKSHTIHYGKIIIGDALIDLATISVFRSPNSYTGEDVVEISCHGGYVVANQIIEGLIARGASLAQAGEFTRRAFLNGKLDLSQVEAVADLIHSKSRPSAQIAARQLIGNFTKRIDQIMTSLIETAGLLELELDFADEDIEFVDRSVILSNISSAIKYCSDLQNSHHSAEILRNGFLVGIAGYPNSGKSTLFNTLLQRHRAIVSPIPGTTRDYIEESIYINDIQIRIIDTAGIRETDDEIEIEGVRLVDSILKQTDLALVINDISISPDNSDSLAEGIIASYENADVLVVQNKIDKTSSPSEHFPNSISAKNNLGIDELKALIGTKAAASTSQNEDVLVNQRQSLLLKIAEGKLGEAINSINSNLPADMIAIDIRDAARSLGEITGKSWSESVLNHIFSQFCIGK